MNMKPRCRPTRISRMPTFRPSSWSLSVALSSSSTISFDYRCTTCSPAFSVPRPVSRLQRQAKSNIKVRNEGQDLSQEPEKQPNEPQYKNSTKRSAKPTNQSQSHKSNRVRTQKIIKSKYTEIRESLPSRRLLLLLNCPHSTWNSNGN